MGDSAGGNSNFDLDGIFSAGLSAIDGAKRNVASGRGARSYLSGIAIALSLHLFRKILEGEGAIVYKLVSKQA